MNDSIESEKKGRTNLRRGNIYVNSFVPRFALFSNGVQSSPAKLVPNANDIDYPLTIQIPDAVRNFVGVDRYYQLKYNYILNSYTIENRASPTAIYAQYWVVGTTLSPHSTGITSTIRSQSIPVNVDGSLAYQPVLPLFIPVGGYFPESYADYYLGLGFGSGTGRVYLARENGSGAYGSTGTSGEYYSDGQWYQVDTITKSIEQPRYPNYLDFVKGYYLDPRIKLDNPRIIPVSSESVIIGYYRWNRLEPTVNLTSIDWVVYRVELIKGVEIVLPIVDCVLNTLTIIDSETMQLRDLINNLQFDRNIYYEPFVRIEGGERKIFDEWNIIRTNNLKPPPTIDYTFNEVEYNYTSTIVLKNRYFRRIGATNNVWKNREITNTNIVAPPEVLLVDGVPTEFLHPMFNVSNISAYNNHIKPQADGSNGILTMDSPRIIEIHAALDAGNYATNRIDSTKKRENNLGYLIESTARVNGIRLDDNGDIDLQEERKKYTPATVGNSTLGEATATGKFNNYGMSCYGKIGLVIPHLPTSYKDGRGEILYDVVHDHQQLMLALMRQLDVSLSIQHGSEIRVNGIDGKVQAYPNQLAVALESLNRLEKISYQVEKNLLVSTVAGTEIRELFSGIGIPVTQKFIKLVDSANKKTVSLPYFGHQKSQPSTAGLLNNLQLNIAVINGILLPKKQPKANDVFNPFKKFVADEKLKK